MPWWSRSKKKDDLDDQYPPRPRRDGELRRQAVKEVRHQRYSSSELEDSSDPDEGSSGPRSVLYGLRRASGERARDYHYEPAPKFSTPHRHSSRPSLRPAPPPPRVQSQRTRIVVGIDFGTTCSVSSSKICGEFANASVAIRGQHSLSCIPGMLRRMLRFRLLATGEASSRVTRRQTKFQP